MKVNNQAERLECVKKVKRVVVNVNDVEKAMMHSMTDEGEMDVVCEHFMDLVVNERLAAKLVCTPSNLTELVIGRLVTEGMIAGIEDVESVYVCESGNTAKVFLSKDIVFNYSMENEPTCCTGNQILLKNAQAGDFKRLSKAEWKPEWIFGLANEFAGGSKIHKATKGTHGCYLSVKGEVVFACEDIGRHNALDKAVGFAAIKGYNPAECILFTTGRVPTDMVKKAVAAKIPVLVSKAVPTDAAVEMAKAYNLTLICRAWPDRYEIFNEAE